MIHITNIDDKGNKTKKFRWVQIGDNPNVLNHCQPMIDKDSVWGNLFATAIIGELGQVCPPNFRR